MKPRPPTGRVSPVTRFTFPACRAHYPGGSRRVHVSIASPFARPSPFCRRVGIRTSTFEACSGFTHVTARRIAQPPKAAFVTRLRSSRSPNQTARQLPEQSTPLWVDPPSTGETRLRGALRMSRNSERRRADLTECALCVFGFDQAVAFYLAGLVARAIRNSTGTVTGPPLSPRDCLTSSRTACRVASDSCLRTSPVDEPPASNGS